MLAHGGTPDEQVALITVVRACGSDGRACRASGTRGSPVCRIVGAWSLAVIGGVVVIAGLTLPRQFMRPERHPDRHPRPEHAIPPRPPRSRSTGPRRDRRCRATQVEVVMTLDGGTIVDSASTTLTPDTGHIHLSLDGKLVSMTYGLVQLVDVSGLSPGRAHARGGVRRRRSRAVRSTRRRADHVHDRRWNVRRVTRVAAHPGHRRVVHARARVARGGPREPRRLGSRRRAPSSTRLPPTVTMTFTEPPDPKLSVVHVLDVNGSPVEAGPVERRVRAGATQLHHPASRRPARRRVHRLLARRVRGRRPRDRRRVQLRRQRRLGTVSLRASPCRRRPRRPSRASRASSCLYGGLAVLFAAAVVGHPRLRGKRARASAGAADRSRGRGGRRRRDARVGAGGARRVDGRPAVVLHRARTSSGCSAGWRSPRSPPWTRRGGRAAHRSSWSGSPRRRPCSSVRSEVTPPPRRPRRSRSACSGSTSWPRACGWAASRWRSSR